MTTSPRVRFAPSPTGYLHVGGARTALFNWLFARHESGTFVLRIEDTDRERSRPELTQAILDGLTWLGLMWDEGPFHQADDIERHRADARRLLDSGRAYRCFCSEDELDELNRRRDEAAARGGGGGAYMYDGRCRGLATADAGRRAGAGEPFALRFRMPAGETAWDDIVHGRTAFANQDIEDFVLLRSDSTPTYNLAVVSDDIAMNITHVIRGADHISNTPKQIQVYHALGAEPPLFAHVPLILGPDAKRLSKRHGAASIEEYRKAGFLPRAMINFLALLGWSPGEDREYMEADELIELFTLEEINKKPAIFDHDKLEWLSGQHLSRLSGHEIAELVGPLLIEQGIASADLLQARRMWLGRVLDAVKVRARKLTDVARQARPFFAGPIEPDEDAVAKHWKEPATVAQRLERLRASFEELESWDEDSLERALRSRAEQLGIGAGKLIHPLRVALTGAAVSPGIFEVADLMGREVVLRRIADATDRLSREETRSPLPRNPS